MFSRRRPPDATYRRSQSVTTVPIALTDAARGMVVQILESGDDHKDRMVTGQRLVDELSHIAGLPPVTITVADRAQVHEHDGQRLQSKTYGYYKCVFANGGVTQAKIRIYHRTAVRQKIITPKVFLNTVLHEWVHHYDFAGLKLDRSPHTTGFYARLRALAEGLGVGFVLPPEPDAKTTAPATADV